MVHTAVAAAADLINPEYHRGGMNILLKHIKKKETYFDLYSNDHEHIYL